MFVYDSMAQGIELLAKRELQSAEILFLNVVNDPYSQPEETKRAKNFLNEIRACQKGDRTLDFEVYKKLVKKSIVSLDYVDELLSEVYFSGAISYQDFDLQFSSKIPTLVSRLKQIKISDISGRDNLFKKMEKSSLRRVKKELKEKGKHSSLGQVFDPFRWKTIYRKFIEQINPVLLERHLELLDYILATGEIQLLDDPKLSVSTPKHNWIIQSTLNNEWYLLRSYFFKARSETQFQFKKKEGTRKYWEEVKYKKIKIFEACKFREIDIQKFLFIDKLNYKTLEEIYKYSQELGMELIPRDVSLALRGIDKSKDHIKERAGFLIGSRKVFQGALIDLGFSKANAYIVAKQAKRSNNHQISKAFRKSLQFTSDEIFWYRIPPNCQKIKADIEAQCVKHLSTVRVHLFERGRLNKLLLKAGKALIRKYLEKIYGDKVSELHCYFRLETIHQYYKLKFFEYNHSQIPSVSELIKVSRKQFQSTVLSGYKTFLQKKRIDIPSSLYNAIAMHKSGTGWEDSYTTTEEKLLLRFWFLMDHGVAVNQKIINSGVLKPGEDIWGFVKGQGEECNS
ncbi:hypothetical protein OAL04_08730 [Nitrospinae bacterium]|nr:hypothetical protein [Nitrospinota bacterium]